MTGVPKVPEIDADNSIDIFVFSNGQQYSPPRKYHICTEDLNLWQSTLSFMARSQYGSLHSNIELFTTEGNKVCTPTELNTGAAYVAVKPPDAFINAGYDKYLIKASRSWDKRHIKPVDKPGGSELQNKRTQRLNEEESILNTIVPSREDHTASVVVIPEPVVGSVKTSQTHVSTVNTIERKRTSIPRPAILKRTSATAPNSLTKPLYKRRDSAKANVKILKPDGQGTDGSTNSTTKFTIKSKNTKPALLLKEYPIPEISLMKIQEESHEIKPLSKTKIVINNDRILSNNSVDIKNAIEDEAIMLVSNLNQNMITYSNLNTNYNTGLDLQSIKIQHKPVVLNVKTSLNEKDLQSSDQQDKQLYKSLGMNDEIRISAEKNINQIVLNSETSPIKNKYADNDVLEQTNEVLRVTNKFDINSIVSKENETNSQELDVLVEEPLHTKHSVMINTPEPSSIQCDSIYTDAHSVRENINIINKTRSVDKYGFSKSYENIKINVFTSMIQSTSTNKSLDEQYVTVLNKGDVVNVKINIEIQNQDGHIVKTIDNVVNVQSNANIMQIEKESQINMNHHFCENRSLVSSIAEEVNENPNVRESFIVVQCNDCKHCKSQNTTVPEKPQNKSIMILMPANTVQENVNGCNTKCEYDQSQNHELCEEPFCAPESQRTLGQSKCLSENIPISKNDNSTAEAVVRKKPVVINGDTISADPSKCCDVNFKIDPVEPSSTVPIVNVMENSTQTEWCDVMLEARLLEDGHYAFRFPTIETLKLYNLS